MNLNRKRHLAQINMIIGGKIEHVIFFSMSTFILQPHRILKNVFNFLHKLPSQIVANKEKEAEPKSETEN